MLNKKGQASFELILVLSITIIFSLVILSYGITNFSDILNYSFFHNAYNLNKVKNNDLGLNKVYFEKNDKNITYYATVYNKINDYNLLQKELEKLKENSKFENIFIYFNVK